MRPAYDLKVVPISAQMLMVELAREHAPCAMYCRFCPRTANDDPRDLPPPTEEDRARVLRDFRRLLETMPTPELFLWSDDLLRYPGLFELLEAARGHKLHIVSPGLELADREFAARFVGMDLRFDLTVHALDEPTFTAMCGNPAAHALVMRALTNLAELGIAHQTAVVVTERNVASLAQTLVGLRQRFGADRVYVRLFYPDALHLPSGYERQFPAFEEVLSQLLAAEQADDLPAVYLSNAPPCQLDLDRLGRLRVFLTPHFNHFQAPDLPACGSCPAAGLCPRLHPAYGRQHAARVPDLARVRAVLEHMRAQDSPDQQDAPRPPVEVLPLTTGAELVIEDRRADRAYWFAGPQLGVWCRLADDLDPRHGERVQRLLARVRERLDRLPPERVSLDDLRRLAAWVKGAL